MDIIEILSSPESSFQARSKRRPARPRRRAPLASDVIEITDSDSDVPLKVRQTKSKSPTKRSGTEAQAEAGPSRVNGAAPAKDQPAAGSVNASLPGRKFPLFLPENDADTDEDDVRHMLEDAEPPQPQVPPRKITPPPDPDPLTQVLEIIPDVQPAYALSLIERYLPTAGENGNVIQNVIHALFEDPSYPKVDTKGKGKGKRDRDDDGLERESKKMKVAHASKDSVLKKRKNYNLIALAKLSFDFPSIPQHHIQSVFTSQNSLYASTYVHFYNEARSKGGPGHLPPLSNLRGATRSGKAKAKGKAGAEQLLDAELEMELEWIREWKSEVEGPVQDNGGQDDDEDGIECGCCFASYSFKKLIQCPEAHLFCVECMTSYVSNLLGSHDANIVCMDQTGCKEMFTEGELRRFMTPKLLELYEKVKMRKSIESAGLEGLEECPYCEYKVVIENPDEKLFRCENAECEAITCRACKKNDHLPKSCKEVEDDKKIDARHVIEEAMTKALMRNCPKCGKGFVKESGCNKMICPHCHTMSCYICRQIITGYEHFGHPPPYTGRQDSNKCQLWDPVEQRHNDEVTQARKKAMEEFKRQHPEFEEKDLQVDLPPPPPAAGPSNANRHLNPYMGMHVHYPPIVPPAPPPVPFGGVGAPYHFPNLEFAFHQAANVLNFNAGGHGQGQRPVAVARPRRKAAKKR